MATPYPDGEGLQVVPQGYAQGLHGRLLNDAPEVYHEDSMQVYHDDGSNGDMKEMHGAAPYDSAPPARKRSVILGLSVPVFWTVVAVIVVVIIGVGVGAGVGVSSKNHSTSSSDTQSSTTPSSLTTSSNITPSSSPTKSSSVSSIPSATSTAGPFPTGGILALDCPNINGSDYTSTQQTGKYTYNVLCNTNYPVTDLKAANATSIQNCLDQCANLQSCQGVVFQSNLTLIESLNLPGNCFLKPNTSAPVIVVQDTFTDAAGHLIAFSAS